mmetsp:Transcript_80223/g.231738  ORF Transcript_80223/g.231738 Transcript_80223/m.231738 type:complete len:450 (-) Transcript_80223:70-1419(-)
MPRPSDWSAWALWAALVVHGPALARGARLEGALPRRQMFAEFVGKFCYDFDPEDKIIGGLEVNIVRDHDAPGHHDGKLRFMIFDDEGPHWKKIQNRWESLTCQQMEQAASLTQDISFQPGDLHSMFKISIHEHLRPRFWYFVFVNCGADFAETEVRYEIHALNWSLGWQSEFSMDHAGLYWVYLVTTLFFSIMGLVFARHSRWTEVSQNPPLNEHPFVQLLLYTYMASIASGALFLSHYTLFVHNGYGSLRLRFLGIVGSIVANCTMYLIVILASTGWAITTAKLPMRRLFLTVVTVFGALHAMCELHAQTSIDQSTKVYTYQGGAGLFALMLKMFFFCWFAFQAKASYDEEFNEKRRRFYKYLGYSVSFWALTSPAVALFAWELSPWVRYKMVRGAEVWARFIGLCLLSQLFCGPASPICHENVFCTRSFDEDILAGPRGVRGGHLGV